ncbi:GNAT family N-acetyltransferase [Nocardioides sp.]|uniref:GNAT family N-acetyltransferase n=1 Tax=Nocardioides sp. TaxID=35761 RepID=UPI002ED432CC
MDYEYAALDFSDESEAGRERRAAWMQAVSQGFHQGRPPQEQVDVWLRHVEADDVECRGVWLPEGAFGAGPVPVATTSWFDKTLNTGRDLLPLRMITDVTTNPAHRRRGLIRTLMEDCLSDAAARGIPLAALTVSETTIYGRWGFGVATFGEHVEVDTGPRFGLRPGIEPAGRVEMVDPRDSWPLISRLLDRHHREHRGSVATPGFYEDIYTGRYHWMERSPDAKLRAAVHLTEEDAEVDGMVLYRVEKEDGKRLARVVCLLGFGADAYLGLWRFLAGIDLVERVVWHAADPADPVRWALADLGAFKTTAMEDFLWVRLLDVPMALGARPWAADGDLVLEVTDAQGHASGRYRLLAKDGVADVSRSDDRAEVALSAETLGSLYLGGVPASGLRDTGRITGDRAAVDRLVAMATLPTQPFNLLGF